MRDDPAAGARAFGPPSSRTLVFEGACILFAFAHWQQAWPQLAPLSAVLLFVLARGVTAPARLSLLLPVALGGVYLLVVSLLNGTVPTNDFGTFVNWVQDHGRLLYTLGLLVVFERVVRIPGAAERFVTRAVQVASILSTVYLVAHYVMPITVAGIQLARDRPHGLLDGANPTAGVTGGAILLGLAQMRMYPARRLHPLWLAPPIGIMVLTFSRGYFLALAVAIAVATYYSLHRLRRNYSMPLRVLLVVAVVVVAADNLVAERFSGSLTEDRNVATRFELWQKGIDAWQTSPLTGFGLGSFQQVNVDKQTIVPGLLGLRTSGEYLEEIRQHHVDGGLHAHNVYVQVLAETGLAGLMLLAGIWLLPVSRAPPRYRFFIRTQAIYLGVAGLTAGLTFLSPSIAWPGLLAVALAWPVSERYVSDRREPDGEAPSAARPLPRAR